MLFNLEGKPNFGWRRPPRFPCLCVDHNFQKPYLELSVGEIEGGKRSLGNSEQPKGEIT